MGVDALTHALDGREVVPSTESDWDDRVSASSTRDYVLDDPLLDWLDRHGEATRRDLSGVDYVYW